MLAWADRGLNHKLRVPHVTRYTVTRYGMELVMALPSERMKALRERRRRKGLREIRLIVPDARSPAVRRRVAKEVAALNQANEKDALDWIEAVYKLDNDETR